MDGGVERSCARSLRFPSRREVISRSHPCSCRTSLKVLPLGCKWSNECRMALLYLSISLLSRFMHPIKILSFEGRERDKKKEEKKERKKEQKRTNKGLSKIFRDGPRNDRIKKRERKRRRREEDTSVVLSSLIGTRPVLSARCQSIIENARRLDERRRDRHRYIYIYDPTRQNSQLQESVRIST